MYPSIELLAKAGYKKIAAFLYRMLEWFYQTPVTANNLAAFYDIYEIKFHKGTDNDSDSNVLYGKMKHYYTLSYKRDPNGKAASSLGYLAYQEKDYKKALYYYKKTLALHKRGENYYNVAVQYTYLQQHDQAIRYMLKALPHLKPGYQRDATMLIGYLYGIGGYESLAREYFRTYISSNMKPELDLFYVAFVCKEYDYIDRYALSLCRDSNLHLEDVELILRTLFMVGKERLADYFLTLCMNQPGKAGDEWTQECQAILQHIRESRQEYYLPRIQIEPILHKKMYTYKKELPFQEVL